MAESDAELLDAFKAEAEEHLEDVEPSPARARGRQTRERRNELVNTIFRAVHSVKGAAGFFDLTTIMALSHSMESLLMRVRDGNMPFQPGMQEPLLAALDVLRDLISALPEVHSLDIEDLGRAARRLVSPTPIPVRQRMPHRMRPHSPRTRLPIRYRSARHRTRFAKRRPSGRRSS